jgi:hypothetical protein
MTAPISIKPKDLMRVLGLSYNQCCRKLAAIRQVNNKKAYQLVTITETADFLGLPEETVINRLQNHTKTV